MKGQLKNQPILKSDFSSRANEDCIRKLIYSYPSLFSIKSPLLSEPPKKLKITGVSSLSLLQGIFPTQQLNLGLSHCRQILYQLSHQGSLRILEWVAYPFSRYSQPRN